MKRRWFLSRMVIAITTIPLLKQFSKPAPSRPIQNWFWGEMDTTDGGILPTETVIALNEARARGWHGAHGIAHSIYVLYGDGIVDDTESMIAWYEGDPVMWPDGTLVRSRASYNPAPTYPDHPVKKGLHFNLRFSHPVKFLTERPKSGYYYECSPRSIL